MVLRPFFRLFFFFNDTATTEIYTISLHDALPIYALDFELPLLELENRIATLQAEDDSPKGRDEIAKLEERLQRLRQKTYASLTAWQRTQLARHPRRPHTRDFIKLLFEDFVELHGDRLYRDDPAIVGGLARFAGLGVAVIGHQKGRDTREK